MVIVREDVRRGAGYRRRKIAFMLLLLLLAGGGESCLIFARVLHVRVGGERLQ